MTTPTEDPDERFAASLLRRATPAAPDPALMARLAAARPAAAPPQASRRMWTWGMAPLSAAAAWAILSLPSAPPATSTPKSEAEPLASYYPPVASSQELLSVKNLGVVRDSLQRPVQLVSSTWLDENYYGQPGQSPALRESSFRHEIVPVVLPVY